MYSFIEQESPTASGSFGPFISPLHSSDETLLWPIFLYQNRLPKHKNLVVTIHFLLKGYLSYNLPNQYYDRAFNRLDSLRTKGYIISGIEFLKTERIPREETIKLLENYKDLFSEVQFLSFTGEHTLNDEFIDELLEIMGPSLEMIRFSSCPYLSPKIFRSLTKHCPNLKKIAVNNHQEIKSEIYSLITNYKNLDAVHLSYCDNLIPKTFEELSKLKNLTTLSLISCKSLNEDHLGAILRNCKRLEDLVLEANPQIEFSEELLYLLVRLKWLQRLSILEANAITTDALKMIIRSNYFLSTLELIKTDLSKVDFTEALFNPHSIKSILFKECFGHRLESEFLSNLSKCNELVQLDLGFCEGINDHSIAMISQSLPSLEYLSFSRSEEFTDKGLKIIETEFPNLKEIHVKNAQGITKKGIKQLKKVRPDLLFQ